MLWMLRVPDRLEWMLLVLERLKWMLLVLARLEWILLVPGRMSVLDFRTPSRKRVRRGESNLQKREAGGVRRSAHHHQRVCGRHQVGGAGDAESCHDTVGGSGEALEQPRGRGVE